MADPPDLAELARRYLDLWREQARLLGDDPVFAGLVESLSKAARQGADATGKTNGAAAKAGAAKAGAAKAGAASAGRPARGGEPDGADLARRLAACEERIARLERKLAKAGGGARPKARRRRPGKPD